MKNVNLRKAKEVSLKQACIKVEEVNDDFKKLVKTIFPDDPDEDFESFINQDYIYIASIGFGKWDAIDLEEIEEEEIKIYTFDEMFEEEFEMGEKVLIDGHERIFFCQKGNLTYCIHIDDESSYHKKYEIFKVCPWESASVLKIPVKLKVTKAQIAEKFEVPVENLIITDL